MPVSYRTPRYTMPCTGVPSARSVAIASVSWISPPLPGPVRRIASKIADGSTYRPMIARLLGASPTAGFSTRPVISTVLPLSLVTEQMP